MQTFCNYCKKETESTLLSEVRECRACGETREAHDNPETTALRAKIERMIADNALHCKQYNAGVDDAKSGKVCGPRPEFDTSTYYDGYAATMLPVLRERIAELEAALKVYADYDNWSSEYPHSRLRIWRGDEPGPDVAEETLKGGE